MAKKTGKAEAKLINDYPYVKGNRYVCSDGAEFTDMYFARKHEKSINSKTITDGTEQN
ncbi:MAG: hypothetical protein PHQ33_08370 [Bacteroidales bacterium]|nr:hypothetical protein [Bacteroidales bacterium]